MSQYGAEAIVRRRELVRRMAEAGHRRNDMARALGVSHGTIDNDLASLGYLPGRRSWNPRRPEPVEWRTGELPEPPPPRMPPRALVAAPVARWHLSVVVAALERYTAAHDEERYPVALAVAITEATEAGDTEWLEHARQVFVEAAVRMAELGEVSTNEEVRRRVMLGHLRVVNGHG